jgi:hypothetical protein
MTARTPRAFPAWERAWKVSGVISGEGEKPKPSVPSGTTWMAGPTRESS